MLRILHLTTACGGASPQGEAYGDARPTIVGNGLARSEWDMRKREKRTVEDAGPYGDVQTPM